MLREQLRHAVRDVLADELSTLRAVLTGLKDAQDAQATAHGTGRRPQGGTSGYQSQVSVGVVASEQRGAGAVSEPVTPPTIASAVTRAHL